MLGVQLSDLDLPTPALLLDLDRVERNIGQMASRARRLGVALRPHVKTHKSVEVARLQLSAGASGLAVSTLVEAKAMVAAGFDDLTWAVPVVPSRLDEARQLAQRATLRLVVDSPEAIAALEATGFPFHVWMKVDCGYGRAGVDPQGQRALDLARRLAGSSVLRFDGLLTHGGHAYHGDRPAIANSERQVMAELAARLRDAGVEVPALSLGSTPGIMATKDLGGIDEARPGNYVFFDYSQVAMGSCRVTDCALSVLASVVSCQPGSGRSVVDAGALALSKDPGPEEPSTFGVPYADYASGALASARLSSISQELGILDVPLEVGSQLRLLPNHSCLTAACFDQYTLVRGERVVGRWKIHRQR